jgi:hypothetical protein
VVTAHRNETQARNGVLDVLQAVSVSPGYRLKAQQRLGRAVRDRFLGVVAELGRSQELGRALIADEPVVDRVHDPFSAEGGYAELQQPPSSSPQDEFPATTRSTCMLAAARIEPPRGYAATIRLVLRRAGLLGSSIRQSSIRHSVIAIWNAVSCRAWAAAVPPGDGGDRPAGARGSLWLGVMTGRLS